jgi:hypothetical protein
MLFPIIAISLSKGSGMYSWMSSLGLFPQFADEGMSFMETLMGWWSVTVGEVLADSVCGCDHKGLIVVVTIMAGLFSKEKRRAV